MARLFGPGYAMKRYGLAVCARLGRFAVWTAGTFAKDTPYYRLKHEPWMFADENGTGAAPAKSEVDTRELLERVLLAVDTVAIVGLGIARRKEVLA